MPDSAATGAVEFAFRDVRGNSLAGPVTIELRQYGGSARFLNHVVSSGEVRVRGLPTEPRRTYQADVTPENHLCSSVFVSIPFGGLPARHDFRFPVRPAAVAGIRAPDWQDLDADWRRVLLNTAFDLCPYGAIQLRGEHFEGAGLYEILVPEQKACLLNLLAKAAATPVGDGDRNCDDFLSGLICLERDRMYCSTRAGFYEEVKHAPAIFHKVSGSLHRPPEGFHVVESFKTADRYGNLQLTFFRKGETGNEYVVDLDIDEASGLSHLFEVARNELLDFQTNPFTIREILIAHQNLDPGYDFVFAQPAAEIEVV